MIARPEFFGLDNLDERLIPYLPDHAGTFVELGAFDGIGQSNTAWLEANKGWRGILIEPIPEMYERCLRNRPLATVVNCACVSSDYDRDDVEVIYAGLMSIVPGARRGADDEERWVARGEEIQHLHRYTVTVPARTLSSILDEYGMARIDLLSVDVEGYELEVLRGLDLQRHRPRHLLVEESTDGAVAGYLTSHGYRPVAQLSRRPFTSDTLFAPTS